MTKSLDNGKPPKKKLQKSTLTIVISLIVAVVVLVGVALFFLFAAKATDPVALKIGENEIKKSQLDEYIELGKASDTSEKTVRNTVIEYEKNKQMAEKYKIEMPEQYVLWTGKRSAATSQAGKVQAAEYDAPDAYQYMARYNRAFASRLAEMRYSGRGVFMYEVAQQSRYGSTTPEESQQATKATAQKYRSAIASKSMAADWVLDEVAKRNAQDGANGKSGFRFIQEYTGAKEDIWTGNLNSSAYIYDTIKNSGTGLSEVYLSGGGSAWFAYTLYEQKAQPELRTTIAEDKAKIKVVIYDEQ